MVPALPDFALAPSYASLPVAGPHVQISAATPLVKRHGSAQQPDLKPACLLVTSTPQSILVEGNDELKLVNSVSRSHCDHRIQRNTVKQSHNFTRLSYGFNLW